MGRVVRRALSALLLLYLVLLGGDGLLTVLDVGTGVLFGVDPFTPVRHVIAQIVFWGALPLYATMAVVPAMWRREIVLPLVTPLVLSAFLNPASLFLSRHLGMRERFLALTPTGMGALPAYLLLVILTNLLQAAVALWALRRHRRSGGLDEPAFSWGRFIVFAGGHVLFLVVAAVPLATFYFGLFLASFSNEFAELGREGVWVVEKEYALGEKRVVLVPMVHVGESSFYRESGRRSGTGDTAVLAEGVRDPSGRLRDLVRDNKVARLVGLAEQHEHFELSFETRPGPASEGAPPLDSGPSRPAGGDPMGLTTGAGHPSVPPGAATSGPAAAGAFPSAGTAAPATTGTSGSAPADRPEPRFVVYNADVDAGDFHETTVEFLALAEGVMKGMEWEPSKVARLVELCSDGPAMDRVMTDLVDRRDERLLEVLFHHLPRFQQIVVPWGFAHLGRVGRSLEARGFRLVARRPRLVLRWPGGGGTDSGARSMGSPDAGRGGTETP